jgi:hypothetical protein
MDIGHCQSINHYQNYVPELALKNGVKLIWPRSASFPADPKNKDMNQNRLQQGLKNKVFEDSKNNGVI